MPYMSRILQLKSLGEAAPQTASKPAAAAPLPPILSDLVICRCCQKGFKTLKRHLQIEHGMSEEGYRRTFGIVESEPLVAPSYAAARARYLAAYGRAKGS